MSQDNVEVVRRAYELVARGDMEELAAFAREHLHPDYEYESDLAGEAFRGVEGALAFITDVRESFEDYTTELEEIADAGDEVMVVSRQSGRGAGSGLHMRWHVHVVWTFDGGKVVRARAFSSRADALEAVALRE
jgi:ketosteroid isomerase-like protein